MKIGLTGCTGRVGSAVLSMLNSKHSNIRALVRQPEKLRVNYPDLDIRHFDFQQSESVSAGLESVDRLFLISPDTQPEQQVAMESELIRLAKTWNVKHIVKVSAYLAGAEPPISFGKYQRRIEMVLEDSGIAYTHLRPAFFMQSLAMFADTIKKSNKILAPVNEGEIAFVDTNDIAKVAVEILINGTFANQALTLTGPEAHSFHDVADKLSVLKDESVKLQSLPKWVARLALPIQAGMSWQYAGLIVEMMQSFDQGSEATVYNSVTAVTGDAPRSLDSYLELNKQLFV